jgi:hypothetical protein
VRRGSDLASLSSLAQVQVNFARIAPQYVAVWSTYDGTFLPSSAEKNRSPGCGQRPGNLRSITSEVLPTDDRNQNSFCRLIGHAHRHRSGMPEAPSFDDDCVVKAGSGGNDNPLWWWGWGLLPVLAPAK